MIKPSGHYALVTGLLLRHSPTITPKQGERGVAKKRRLRRGIFLGAAIAAVAFTVSGVTGCTSGSKKGATSTPAPPAAVLDGTYRLDYDGAKVTANGAPTPQPNTTFWYAFRSSCGSTGCVATETRLDDKNHQVAFTPATTSTPATKRVLRFVGGHWQAAPVRGQLSAPQCLGANGTVVAGEDTQTETWSLTPGPDGTLRGVETDTFITNNCGFQGGVWQTPIVATRVGDVPAGVTVPDPATVSAPAPPAPTVAGPTLNGTYSVDIDNAHQTRKDGVPITKPRPNQTHWYALRSLCTSSGCVATGAELFADNHQMPAGTGPLVLHFADGHWQDTPYLVSVQCTGTGQTASETKTIAWSLEPQPDGTLRGVDTLTVLTDECGNQGKVFQTPMAVTRQGDVPPAVILADPTLFF
jgi:hypothetical protein